MAEDDLMADFTPKLYSKQYDKGDPLTERESQQLKVARIIYTSVDDARTAMAYADTQTLEYALKYCAGRPTLKK